MADHIRDVFVLALSSKTARPFVEMITERLDPPCEVESMCRNLIEAPDEAFRTQWCEKNSAKHAALKEACKRASVPVSGNKHALVKRLRVVWLQRGMTRGNGPRTLVPGLSLNCVDQAKDEYRRFALRPVRQVEQAFGLDPGTLRGDRPPSRSEARTKSLAKYGSVRGLRDHLIRAEDDRMRGIRTRRRELQEALSARRPGLVVRPDSEICRKYIEGDPSSYSLPRVVDVVEEMDFLYKMTLYPTLLRSARAYDRSTDREFGSDAYWRKRDMVKDGLIETMDDDTPDASDVEGEENGGGSSLTEEEREEVRRRVAKEKALRLWLEAHPSEEVRERNLPRTFFS